MRSSHLSDSERPGVADAGRDSAGGLWNRQTRMWLVVALVLAVAGCAGTVVVASVQSAQNGRRRARRSWRPRLQVASTLEAGDPARAGPDRERGRVLSAIRTRRNPSSCRWTAAVRAFQRYPEILGLGHVVIVPVRRLPPSGGGASAIRRSAVGQRKLPGVAAGPPAVLLLRGGRERQRSRLSWRRRAMTSAAGRPGEPCHASIRERASTSRSARAGHAAGRPDAGLSGRHGARDRRATPRELPRLGRPRGAPGVLLAQALAGHPGIAVSFSYHAGSSNAAFHAGSAPRGAQSLDDRPAQRLDGAHVLASLPATGLFAGGRPGALLVAGHRVEPAARRRSCSCWAPVGHGRGGW